MLGVARYWLSNLCDGIKLLRSVTGDLVSLLADLSRRAEKDSQETTGK